MPYLAPSLDNLRDEVDKRWPNRSKASDGWIGDPAHASRPSDHNPNGRGSVNALDITSRGIDVPALIRAAIKHPSTNYVISRGLIYSRSRGFKPVTYTGSNPHTTHVHVSIVQTRAAEWDNARWFVTSTFPLPSGHSFGNKKSATVHDGTANLTDAKNVQRIQKRLQLKPTGRYGPVTLVRVANWQVVRGIKPTGRVGAYTWKRLGL